MTEHQPPAPQPKTREAEQAYQQGYSLGRRLKHEDEQKEKDTIPKRRTTGGNTK